MASVLLLVKLKGKQRLSHMYTEGQRQKLMVFFFERMLRILKGFTIYVATPDELPGGDYEVIKDEWGDINTVITKVRNVVKDDFLILPCDLPFLEREDIDILIEEKVVIVPSQNGGTSALFLPVSIEIETQFGINSYENHLNLLKYRNLEYGIYESDQFRDVDTEEDIMWALEHKRDSEFCKFVKEELR
jgi:2-phospho-L-lactate guanylyltransferase